jgi:hypothetical protein
MFVVRVVYRVCLFSSWRPKQQLFGSSSDNSGENACQTSPLLPANSSDFMLSFTLEKQDKREEKDTNRHEKKRRPK